MMRLNESLFPQEEPEPARGLGPLQLVCLIGSALSIILSLVAFEELSVPLIVLGLGFACILVLGLTWEGLTTGQLQFRGQLVSSSVEPVRFTVLLVFQVGIVIAVVYFGLDILLSDL